MNRSLLHMTDVAGAPIWDLSAALVSGHVPNIAASTNPKLDSLVSSTTHDRDTFDEMHPNRVVLDNSRPAQAVTARTVDFWADQPRHHWNIQGAQTSIQTAEQLKLLYDMRTVIFDNCIDVYIRESLRKDFCWFDWKPLIANIGEPAVTLWKSIIVGEMRTPKRLTLPIDDPEMLKHLSSAELDHLSRLYNVRLKTTYENLDKLLNGEYANVISDFERESILRMPKIIPAIMLAIREIDPKLDAAVKYFGRIAEYTRMLNFIAAQAR